MITSDKHKHTSYIFILVPPLSTNRDDELQKVWAVLFSFKLEGDKGLISYYLTNIQNPGAGRWVKENTVGAGGM